MKLCRKCSKKIKTKQIIKGKVRNLSKRKYCIKCSPFNSHNTRRLEIKTVNNKLCVCGRLFSHKGTKCYSCAHTKKRHNLKYKLIVENGGKCFNCGYKKCLGALQFHHKNPKEKEFSISGNHTLKHKTLYEEVKKCIILCANCHSEESCKNINCGIH